MARSTRGSVKWFTIVWTAILMLFTDAVRAANTSIFDPASGNADSIADIFYVVLGVTGAIFVVVFAAMIVFMIRYRMRPGASEAEPPQIYGSWPIEVAWTVTPVLIIFVLFLIIFRSVLEQRPGEAPEHAITVRVVGHQWWWDFQYPDHGVVTANELHLPLGPGEQAGSVFLDLESADVIHSFWVPRLTGKTDLVPNRVNHMWFEPQQVGTYLGQCAEYCGTQHAKMLLRVIVHSQDDFQEWVDNQKQPAVNDPTVDEGRRLFLSMACANCHTIRGTTAAGTFAPDLTHLMSRETIASGAADNNREELTAWITDPNTIKSGSKMPDMHLTKAQVERIVDYLETLR